MKYISFIFLIVLGLTYQVSNSNRCTDCSQFKSERDCEQQNRICEWIITSENKQGKCEEANYKPIQNYTPYCELVDQPEINCAQTLGCAYINSKCTHFTGCQAYVKTTTADCLAISYFCVSDGTACIQAKECKQYTKELCESISSVLSGILKCKWKTSTGICINQSCSEADLSLNTDEKCSSWLAGCVTKGQGCVDSPRPACATYTGDDADCQSFIGSDGYCELATGKTNCKAKECQNASSSFTTDDNCKAYQRGCISTGKGCVFAKTKPLCKYYSGDNTTCVGYIGSDGVCEGDVGGSKCRARKCENAIFSSDALCEYYQSSCKTNGKTCVSQLTACNTYKGTATTCAVYIGTDGICKGTSTIEASCLPKVCEEAPESTQTDAKCNRYQVGCVTTGKGCVTKNNLKSCTTYDGDDTSCYSRIGSEGKCIWKSGTKCVARDCTEAKSNLYTNPLCASYFTNCVTTGSGCVSQTTCDLTVKQQSCEGTNNCQWQPICTSNATCSEFKKKSICLANQARVKTLDKIDDKGNPIYIYLTKKCGWFNNACKELACSDLTGPLYNNDSNCSAELSTCISNQVDACITKYECNKLTGTQSTCSSYLGYCTNTLTATDATPCILRKCSDNINATDNAACTNYLPECIHIEKGCVHYTTPCTSIKGTQETCNKIFAYKSGSIENFITNQCYNIISATENIYCQVKTCKLAENQNDDTCGLFLEGCVYNGNGGCVDPKADDTTCASYTGTEIFCESAIVGNNTTKYCFGTSTTTKCTLRVCTDNTIATNDEDCEDFMSGCIAKSEGGCISKQSRSCSQQTGSVTTCPNYSGGLYVFSDLPFLTKVGCTKYDACQDRLCSDITNPSSAQECLNYKSTCRFLTTRAACIDQAACSSYNLPDTATTDEQKFDYCTNIQDNNGLLCGYTMGASNCSIRSCDQFLSKYTILSCITYLQKNISTQTEDKCELAGTICYLPIPDCAYNYTTTDITDTLKLNQCKKFVNDKGIICTFKTGDTKCSIQDTCEKLINQKDERTCNDQNLFLSSGKCQQVRGSTCLTLSTACTDYQIDSTLSFHIKQNLCWGLKVIDDQSKITSGSAVYMKCIYKTGSTCDAISACSDIYSSSSQTECETYKPGCLYYGGKCYANVTSGFCPTTFPNEIKTDSQKSLYCRSIKEASDYCSLASDKTKCVLATNVNCTDIIIPTLISWDGQNYLISDAFKSAYCLVQSYKDRTKSCKYTPENSTTVCSDATCSDIPSPTSQGDCDNYIYGCIYYNNKCYPPTLGVTADDDCTDNAKVPIDSKLTAAQKVAYCQSFSASDKSIYCTYNQYSGQLQIQCTVGGPCDSYIDLPASHDTDKQTYCLSKINKTGKRCAFTETDTKCRDFDCYDIQYPTSQIHCDLGAPGKPCIYLLGTCYNRDTVCTSITAQSGNEKLYCNQVTVAATICTYISGTKCSVKQDCHLYRVTSNQATVCATLTDNSGNRCTYLGENNCVKLDVCSTYDGTTLGNLGPTIGKEDEQCKQVKSANNYPCIRDSVKKCRAQVCTDNDASATDCVNNAEGCLYYFNKCIITDICSNYTAQGDDDSAKQTWCEGVQNSLGDFCAWDPVNIKCRDRLCSDIIFYTDLDCQSYLKTCKTNGRICVSSYSPCSSNNGSSDFCNSLLDSTGEDRCKLIATASTVFQACKNKTCYDNVTAKTDSECDNYLSGCVTRGTGCIPNTEPCTSYRGTKQQCELFKKYTGLVTDKKPSFEYCSGEVENTATSKCKVRTCSDNTTSKTDVECATYQKGCITKGIGCIDATSSCTAFKGDQAICAKFMGNSNKIQCWNTPDASAQSDCNQKKCSDISGKNNKECNDGMPPKKASDDPFCVFDGTQCIDYGKLCKSFQGTEKTCPTFLAKDGPCKATTVGIVKGACAKRVCTEAPNSLITDADCQKYHKDCYTTGYGCTSVNQCNSIISRQLCQGKSECTWAKYCTDQITKCETYNNTSYSQCANSKLNGKFCFWDEHYSICKSQTCENQPVTLDSHTQCQNFADNCTTTGAGCITISDCALYINKSICNAASSSRDGLKRCIWDNILKSCRNKICSDISAQINAECEAFELGCKLNGQKCVNGLSCTEFTNKLFCLKSKTGPCLWVNGQCYDYGKCEDAVKKTHPECQAFSPLCTTNGDRCIPITTCENTSSKVSCIVGTNGACGWLPKGKCYKFGQCTDAIAATNDECLSYGSTCITDGTVCIAKSTCSNYITQIACANKGTDGICYWNVTSNNCKLKECTDEQKGTNDLCKLISVTSGLCTTDGTKCIPQSTCSSYVEAGCFNGTDGECIYALPVGATTGNKICRLKYCEDISGGTSNANCMGVITGLSCVSNGTNCISKAACSSYKIITACNGGGFENNISTVCAFIPIRYNSFQGICKTFSACSDANQDELACLSNPSCKWSENEIGFSCESHTCETYAIETECRPIPSFDGNYSTICLMQNGKCVSADPITITDPRLCYIKSAYTHSWNILTSKCESCIPIKKQTSDNPINSQDPNTLNSKFFLSLCLWGLLSSFQL
ncbi:unnamed protein product [Paramecium pentaurelia]|uniref:Uncharacterized protein n=1 Tax=Paramecium pentaurelia TaxID=43138 RepID=A0A8S1YI00_9CILI|nr:unnamed protein product [Paramecium pentaurelia]